MSSWQSRILRDIISFWKWNLNPIQIMIFEPICRSNFSPRSFKFIFSIIFSASLSPAENFKRDQINFFSSKHSGFKLKYQYVLKRIMDEIFSLSFYVVLAKRKKHVIVNFALSELTWDIPHNFWTNGQILYCKFIL